MNQTKEQRKAEYLRVSKALADLESIAQMCECVSCRKFREKTEKALGYLEERKRMLDLMKI